MHYIKNIKVKKQNIIIAIYSLFIIICTVFCCLNLKHSNIYSVDFSTCSLSNSDTLWAFSTPYLFLNEGQYTVEIAYCSTSDAELNINADNDIHVSSTLSASPEGNIVNAYFTLPFPTDKSHIEIVSENPISLITIKIMADHKIFTDYYLFIILLLFSILPFSFFYQHFFKSSKYSRKMLLGILSIIILACGSVWICKPVPMAGDIRSHLQRIQGIYEGLKSGQFPVIIYPNQVNEFGQLGVLYPNTFLYFPGILRLLGVSMLTAYKLYDSAVAIITVLVAYHVSKKFFDNGAVVLLSTLLYTLCFSRLRSQLWGCTCGYGTAMIFIPLLIYGIYSILYEEKSHWEYVTFGFTGIISSHVITSVVTFVIIIMFLIINLNHLKNRKVVIDLLKTSLTLILSTSYISIPFIYFYSIGINKSNLSWSSFIDSLWSPLELFNYKNQLLEMIMLISVLVFVYIIIKNKLYNNLSEFYLKALLIYIVCTLFETTLFPWKYLDSIFNIDKLLSSIQQADRIRYSTLFFIVISFCYFLELAYLHNKTICKVSVVIVLLCISISTFYNTISYIQFSKESTSIDNFVSGSIESKIDADYLPQNTFEEYYQTNTGEVSNENIIASYKYEKHGTNINYSYSATSDGEYAEFPLLYYQGYTAYDDNGLHLPVENGKRNRVRVVLPYSESEKNIFIKYKTNSFFLLLPCISLFSIILVVYTQRKKFDY